MMLSLGASDWSTLLCIFHVFQMMRCNFVEECLLKKFTHFIEENSLYLSFSRIIVMMTMNLLHSGVYSSHDISSDNIQSKVL